MKNIISSMAVSCLLVSMMALTLGAQDHWTRFRGENGNGVVPDDPRLPVNWTSKENVQWKTKILGWGW